MNFKNYVLYYGVGKEEKLSDYELAIVESLGQTEQSIRSLKEHQTTVLAYVSFLEVHAMSYGYERLGAEDYLSWDGTLIENHSFQTKLVSLQSKRWQSILLDFLQDLIEQQRYDGIFIDTLADIEYFDLPEELRNSLLNGAAALLKMIRERYPNIIIIQNNGFEYLYRCTASYLDGICIENPRVISRSFVDKLCFLKKVYGLEVLLLTNRQPGARQVNQLLKVAKQYGFPIYHASTGYESLH
jgi:endo-alpha-1,4-polygalactosaminidase (GH114 family)